MSRGVAALALGLLLIGLILRPRPDPIRLPQNPGGPIAMVDLSHQPLAPADRLIEHLRASSIAPVAAQRWEGRVVRHSRIVILPPSFAAPTESQLRQLEALMTGGGLVLVSAGKARTDTRWLAYFGIRLRPRPIGGGTGVPASEDIPTADFEEAWALALSRTARALIHLRDHPVVAETVVGAGRLVVIADRHFFDLRTNRNRAFASWLYRKAR